MAGAVKSRMVLMLIIVGIILGGVFGFQAVRGMMIKKYMASMSAPPQTVSTIQATYEQWTDQLETVGSLRAAKGTDITVEVAGIVDTINFTSGDNVKEGTELLKLRMADDIAKLHSLEAAAKLASVTYERDLKQIALQAISQATLDTDAASLATANAQVAEQKAIVDKKILYAPFSGHLGIRNVDIGQYINAGTAIVTLQQLETLYLDFMVPEQDVSQIAVGKKVTIKNDSWPNQNFTGTVKAINPKVDVNTRNLQVRAEINNESHKLLPGMYATARIETGLPQRYITLPQTAITYNPYGNIVFLVKEKGKNDKGEPKLTAEQSFVTTGATRGDQVAILSGVKEGDLIVSSGQLKLQNGSPIIVNNKVIPSDDPHPKPIDQ